MRRRFRGLIAELGHGGMADVFLAVERTTPGPKPRPLTVIKRLRQNLVEEPEFVDMLVDEGKLAARLVHPNVVRTNEVGSFDGQYFIEMEYLDGQPLHRIQNRAAQRAKDGKPSLLQQDHQLIVVLDACAGLDYAHGLADDTGKPLSIVHRDVTPQNIFVQYDGHVKVVDFGIAKAAGRASETRQGIVKGKIRYMAPEQALSEKVDRRADVFSIGIMLWEVVARRRLWFGVEDLEILRMLSEGTYPASPRSVDPTVPEELDRICARALERDREKRFASADELRDHLEHYLASTGRLLQARRELATSVSELFGDKRAEIEAVIDRQLAALDRPSVSPGAEPPIVPAGPDSTPNSIQPGVRGSGTPSGSVKPAAASPPPALTRPLTSALVDSVSGVDAFVAALRRRRRNGVAAAIAVLVIACGLGFGVWQLALEPATTAAPLPPATAAITLRLKAAPADARIAIDDGPLAPAPVTMQVARDGRDHHVRFEADGFVTRTEVVGFRDDLAMFIALAPADSASEAGVAAADGGTK